MNFTFKENVKVERQCQILHPDQKRMPRSGNGIEKP